MKYEFHVGDYVAYSTNHETCTGYVREYIHPAFSNEYYFVFQWDNGMRLGWSGRIEELPHNFIRIGQYDFTKPEQPKEIKRLSKEYNDLYSKINELVDAVNELRKDKNE